MVFLRIFRAEWLKKKGSIAYWMVLMGAFFIPLVQMLTYLVYPERLLILHQDTGPFWELVFQRSWNLMSTVFLPMGIVIATSMLCQLEFKNNAWKQVHAAPVHFSTLYFAKLAVVLVMLVQLVLLFNVGMYLAVSIPSLFHGQVPYPAYPIAYSHFLYENVIYFYMCIPLLLFQFALGLLFRNFVVPVGIGLTLVVAGIAAISWKYNYMIPSLYPFLYFLSSVQPGAKTFDLMNWTSIYTAGFLLAGYLSYVLNPRKG